MDPAAGGGSAQTAHLWDAISSPIGDHVVALRPHHLDALRGLLRSLVAEWFQDLVACASLCGEAVRKRRQPRSRRIMGPVKRFTQGV